MPSRHRKRLPECYHGRAIVTLPSETESKQHILDPPWISAINKDLGFSDTQRANACTHAQTDPPDMTVHSHNTCVGNTYLPFEFRSSLCSCVLKTGQLVTMAEINCEGEC